jgi:hypothetical protein
MKKCTLLVFAMCAQVLAYAHVITFAQGGPKDPETETTDGDNRKRYSQEDDKLELQAKCDLNFYDQVKLDENAWSGTESNTLVFLPVSAATAQAFNVNLSVENKKQYFLTEYVQYKVVSVTCKDGSLKEIELRAGFSALVTIKRKKAKFELNLLDLAADVQKGKVQADIKIKVFGFRPENEPIPLNFTLDVEGFHNWMTLKNKLIEQMVSRKQFLPQVHIVKEITVKN